LIFDLGSRSLQWQCSGVRYYMNNENKSDRLVINLLYVSNIVFAGSIDNHFIPYPHGTIGFIVGTLSSVLISLVITAVMTRHLEKFVIVIAIPVILLSSAFI
jgi:hypothetical protein